MSTHRFRLVTRSDFDGIACAVLLKALALIDDILFVHPNDVQDGVVELGPGDITANLPYAAAVHLAFDHHAAEAGRTGPTLTNQVIDPQAPSTARVIWNHHGGAPSFPTVDPALIDAVDRTTSASHTLEDVLSPAGWTLLGFLADPRTGLGRFRDFRVSNHRLMRSLVDACRRLPVASILSLPDVAERVALYRAHVPLATEQLLHASTVEGNAVVVDLRDREPIWATNRFTVYALFPQCNLSIHRMWGRQGRNAVFALGRSILERTCVTDVGALCRRYGGGGMPGAGTCQVGHELADRVYDELLAEVHRDEARRLQGARGR